MYCLLDQRQSQLEMQVFRYKMQGRPMIISIILIENTYKSLNKVHNLLMFRLPRHVEPLWLQSVWRWDSTLAEHWDIYVLFTSMTWSREWSQSDEEITTLPIKTLWKSWPLHLSGCSKKQWFFRRVCWRTIAIISSDFYHPF